MLSESLFFGGVLPSTTRTSPVLLSRGAACGVPRESERGAVSSEALGRMDQLRPQTAPPRLAGPSYCIDLAHTVGAQWIEPHAVLFGYQVLLQFGL